MQKVVAAFLASSLLFPTGTVAQDLRSDDGIAQGPATQETVAPMDNLPKGSRVRIEIYGGEVTGTLVEARTDAIVLRDTRLDGRFSLPVGKTLEDPASLARSDVRRIAIVQTEKRYKADEQQNPASARVTLRRLVFGRTLRVGLTRRSSRAALRL